MGYPILLYKKSLFFYIVASSVILALGAGATFLALHIFDVSTYRQQNAFGAALLFHFLAVAAYVYLDFHNFNFTVSESSIEIQSTSLSRNLNRKISFKDIKKVEAQLMSKQLKLFLVDETNYVLRFLHTRTSGELADTAHLGNPNGTLREIINLRNEIENRIRSS